MKVKLSFVETAVGVFVALSAAGLAAGIFLKSRELGWFEPMRSYRFELPSSMGVQENTKVLVRGITAGYVRNVALTRGNRVAVEIVLRERFAEKLTRRASVEVVSPPFGIGEARVTVDPGSDAPPLPDGGTIPVKKAAGDIGKKAEYLAGEAGTALRSGGRLFDTLDRTAREVLGVLQEYRAGRGAVHETMKEAAAFLAEARETNRRAARLLDALEAAVGDVKKLARDTAGIAAAFRQGKGPIAALVESTRKFTRDMEPAGRNIAKITAEVLRVVGKTSTAIDRLNASRRDVEQITASLRDTMKHLESISGKIDEGKGALGQFVNDEKIYAKVEKAVDTTADLMKSLRQVKTWVRVEDQYWGGLGVNAFTMGLRIEPRPSRYFFVGGVFIKPFAGSAAVTRNDEMVLEPDVQVAQRLFDGKMTARVGLLEGKVGAGLDWDVFYREDPARGIVHTRLRWVLEGRDSYDDRDYGYDENVEDFILRTHIEYTFARYFFVSIGVDDILNGPGFMVSLGFEYVDRDITTVVGLMNLK